MAAINKRGPHQWRAQIRKNGFPPQSKTFTTKAEAEAWVQMTESEMTRGVWVSRGEAESTSLDEALTRYELEITPGKKTANGEKSFIRILRATSLAKRSLASIRSTDVAQLRDAWLRDGYAPATVVRRLALLSHVFSIARKEWGMESLSNPIEVVRKPQLNDARTRRIADAEPGEEVTGGNDAEGERTTQDGELERIIAASGSALLPAVIALAVETAMRRSEIIALRWEHIDLKRRVAHLPATKNGSARDVPLSSRAVAVLQTRKEASQRPDPDGDAEEPETADLGRVFAIRNDAVTRAFERAVTRARKTYLAEAKDAGHSPDLRFLTDLRFHDLRHEATTRLASIFPMHELAKITGHKDPRMLMRYYHPRAEDLAKRLA
jgi:integrase